MRKLSFRALAEKSGVSKSTLNDIENNNVKSTTLATLEKISESEVFTLAAKFINYEEPLTELDIEKMKMSLKIALAKIE